MYKSIFFDLPEKFYFDAGNSFSASKDSFNVKIVPENYYKIYVWYGQLCLEKSEAAAQTEYDINDKGFDDMLAWIDRQYEKYSENK